MPWKSTPASEFTEHTVGGELLQKAFLRWCPLAKPHMTVQVCPTEMERARTTKDSPETLQGRWRPRGRGRDRGRNGKEQMALRDRDEEGRWSMETEAGVGLGGDRRERQTDRRKGREKQKQWKTKR